MATITFESLDAVPEALRDYAEEKEGKFAVAVAPETKLKQFRENNISLSQERDQMVQRLQMYQTVIGDDFETFNEELSQLRQLRQKVDDKDLIEASSLQEAIARRTEQMKADFSGQIEALAKDRDTHKARADEIDAKYRNSIIERAITDAVLHPESGARPEALSDVLARAKNIFRVGSDGQIRPYEGDTVIYGGDGTSPMTPIEWLKEVRKQAPYLFKDSTGGGATGGETAGSHGVRTKADLKSPAAKAHFIRENGSEAYFQLPD